MSDEEPLENNTLERIAAWRLALKSFTSQWFLIPQGTGIIAVILHNLHYQFYGLVRISQVFWVLTILQLVLFLAIYILRITLYPHHTLHLLNTDIMETAGLSSICITYTTIIQLIVLNLVVPWGPGWGSAAHILWWTNAALALITNLGSLYFFIKTETPGIENLPPGVLLPCIAALTAAAGGGVVCRYGELGAGLEVPVIIVSYLFVGLGLSVAVVIHGVFMVRLFDKSFPLKGNVYQIMVLCGPLGQGSFALQILGTCVQRGAFAEYGASNFLGQEGGRVIGVASQFAGLLVWGYGVFWWGFACIAIANYAVREPGELWEWKKSLASWGMVFPWGVFTNAAVQLGVVLSSRAFHVWSTILTVVLVILWLGNSLATVVGVLNGKVLGLDRGWRGEYYVDMNEGDKDK